MIRSDLDVHWLSCPNPGIAEKQSLNAVCSSSRQEACGLHTELRIWLPHSAIYGQMMVMLSFVRDYITTIVGAALRRWRVQRLLRLDLSHLVSSTGDLGARELSPCDRHCTRTHGSRAWLPENQETYPIDKNELIFKQNHRRFFKRDPLSYNHVAEET